MDPRKTAEEAQPFLSLDAQEKASAPNETQPLPDNQRSKMASKRRLVLALSLSLLVLFGLASAGVPRPCHRPGAVGHAAVAAQTPTAPSELPSPEATQAAESFSFSAMLSAASPESLHELLHRFFPRRFKSGVYLSERQAIEALREADAPLATSILLLAKRDDSNTTAASTSSTDVPSPSSSIIEPPPSSSPEPEPEPSSSQPPAESSSQPPVESSTPPPPASSSTAPPPSSPSETSAPPPESSAPTSISDTTLSTTTIPGDSSTEPPPTTTPPPSSKQVVETFTRTSNGLVVTITSTSWVAPEPTQSSSASDQRNLPSLQNDASSPAAGNLLLAGVLALGAAVLV